MMKELGRRILRKTIKFFTKLLLVSVFLIVSVVLILSLESVKILILKKAIDEVNVVLAETDSTQIVLTEVTRFSWSELAISKLRVETNNDTWINIDQFKLQYQLFSLIDQTLDIPLIEFKLIQLKSIPQFVKTAIEKSEKNKSPKSKNNQPGHIALQVNLPIKINLQKFTFRQFHIQPNAFKEIIRLAKLNESLSGIANRKEAKPLDELAFSLTFNTKIMSADEVQANLLLTELRLHNNHDDFIEASKTKGIEPSKSRGNISLSLVGDSNKLLIDYSVEANQLYYDTFATKQVALTGKIALSQAEFKTLPGKNKQNNHQKKTSSNKQKLAHESDLAINDINLSLKTQAQIKQLKLDNFKPQTVTINLNADYANNTINIQQLKFNTPWISNYLLGSFDIKSSSGYFKIKTRMNGLDSLENQFTKPTLKPMFKTLNKSSVNVDSNIKINQGLSSIETDLKGSVSHLSLSDEEQNFQFQQVVGNNLALKAKVLFDNKKQHVNIKALSIDGKATSIVTQGNVDLAKQKINVEVKHQLNNFSILSQESVQIDGALHQELMILGDINAPLIKFNTSVEELIFDQYQFELINLVGAVQLKDEDEDEVEGQFHAFIKEDKHRIDLSSSINVSHKKLSLFDLSLSSNTIDLSSADNTTTQSTDIIQPLPNSIVEPLPNSIVEPSQALNHGSKFLGDIVFGLDDGLLKGEIHGVAALERLFFLHKRPDLSGKIELNIQLNSGQKKNQEKGQLAQLDIKGSDISFTPEIDAETATKKFNLSNINITTNYAQFSTNENTLENQSPKNIQPEIELAIEIDKLTDEINKKNNLLLENTRILLEGTPKHLNLDIKSNQLLDINHFSTQIELVGPPGSSINSRKLSNKKGLQQVIKLHRFSGIFAQNDFNLNQMAKINFIDATSWSIESMTASWGETLLSIDALSNTNKLQANVGISQFPLSTLQYLNIEHEAVTDLSGSLNFDLDLTGSLEKPIVNIVLDAKDMHLKNGPTKNLPHSDIQLSTHYSNNLLSIDISGEGFNDEVVIQSGKESNQSKVKVDIPIDGKISLPVSISLMPFNFSGINKPIEQVNLTGEFKTNIDLEQIQDWLVLDQQLIKGHLLTDIKLLGQIANPKVIGTISLNDGYYENGATGTLLQKINLTLLLEKEQLLIKKFLAEDVKQGKITATGQVSLIPKDKYAYAANLNLGSVQLVEMDDLKLKVSGKTQMNGNQLSGNILSQLTIDEGQFYLPDNLPVNVPELEVTEVVTEKVNNKDSDTNSTGKTKAPVYPLNLDVNIKVKPNMYVRGRGLESQWLGDINITGTAQEPMIEGELNVNRGFIDFLSKRFTFRQGNINFYGGLPIKPQLDFEFEATGNDMLAILSIQGLADKPVFNLTSEPALPKDEVLSKLLFGKDIQSISALQALQLVSALRTLSTGGSGIMDETRNSLGIDTLDIHGGTGGGAVKAGKHLNDKVYVEVESDLGSGGSEVKVEYEVTETISVESRVDEKSNTGVGVNWKLDY